MEYLEEPNPNNHRQWGTKIQLTCEERNHYFDFSVPADLVSFFYSNNINRTTMYCNKDTYWVFEDGYVEGETCSSAKTDEMWCKSVVQPNCVDRTVRCGALQSVFGGADKELLAEPNPDDHTEYGTSIRLTCPQRNYYFDFSVPSDLVSYFYSNNINETVITCNRDG